MNMRISSYAFAAILGAAGLAAPAAAQHHGFGGHAGGVGIGARSSFNAGVARPSFNVGLARPAFNNGAGYTPRSAATGAAFAARPAPAGGLITGRSVAAPGLLAAGAAPGVGARFAGRPGFNPYWRGGQRRVWPYAAAGLGIAAYGVGAYGYDAPYDTGYYDADDVAAAAAADYGDEGGSCATPALVCRLYEPAPVGIGCTCTVGGFPARGIVQP